MSLEALGPLEDDEELEPLKKLLSDEVDAGRDTAYWSGTHSLIGG